MGDCDCQNTDKLKDKPENCSPEQIEECHGDTKKHDCGCGCGGHGEGKEKDSKQ